MTAETRYEVNHPDVVDESVDGEALIVHLGTGTYYSARGTGDVAWQWLSTGSTSSEVAQAFGDSAAARESIGRFLSQLVDEGLVRPSAAASASSQRPAPAIAFEDPKLEKYTDMQELLLLDPIHDVEEEGWPKARPGAAEGEV